MTYLNEIKGNVINEYICRYPNWTDIRVTEYIKNSDDGYYLVVKAKENEIETEGEICFVDNDKKVRIFSTIEELINFIGDRQSKKWYLQLFTKTGVSAIVTLVLLVTLCILVFKPGQADQQVLQFIGGAFLAAIGFLFGTTTTPKAT
ncbi:hypothetical protein [Cyclobacterium plantarum]|uniref:hypothetical protein n=1 Tax=Cyclobacterium plantarum TaxID=2716263 RepID=UPI003F72FB7E